MLRQLDFQEIQFADVTKKSAKYLVERLGDAVRVLANLARLER